MIKDIEKRKTYHKIYHKTHPRDRRVYMKKWRSENPEKLNAQRKNWRQNNLILYRKITAECSAKWKRYHIYGISEDVYQKMMTEQSGRCTICGDSHRPLCIDHNHITKEVRGLLCSHCNSGLGMFKDNKEFLNSAIGYLQKSELGSSLSRSNKKEERVL